ncbi:hypothetical protein [Streptomyces sp. NPDC005131]
MANPKVLESVFVRVRRGEDEHRRTHRVPGGEQVHDMRTEPNPALAELRARLEAGLTKRSGLNKTTLARNTQLGRTTVQGAFQADGPVPTARTVTALAAALKLPVAELLELQRTAAEADSGVVRGGPGPGRPIEEWEPHALEVHRAIQLGDPTPMPQYVKRDHDKHLRMLVGEAAAGSSGLTMLVGTSSTGKTRACWEAIQRLPKGWRLWHPIDPERPQAAIGDLPTVGPRTVVWLNDAHHYLLDADHGEAIASGLRTLLNDPSRAPVLVLGTMWPGPDHYGRITATHPGTADRYHQARVLLAGRVMAVPGSFNEDQVEAMRTSSDRRLVEAAQHAADGMITQYLAAAPDLLSHYQTAEPGPRALLEAAMDARRLGCPLSLPRSFLKKASEGYLTPTEWELLPDPDNWVDQALATLKQPLKGTPGPLHAKRRERGASDHQGTQAEQAYVLADFLDQHGHKTRRASRVPGLFWQAALDHWEVAASRSLAGSADARGLIKFACELWAKVGDYLSVADRLADADRLNEALPWYKRAAEDADRGMGALALRSAANCLTARQSGSAQATMRRPGVSLAASST